MSNNTKKTNLDIKEGEKITDKWLRKKIKNENLVATKSKPVLVKIPPLCILNEK